LQDTTWKPRAVRVRSFLDAGDKVKFTVRFRGREMAHPEIGTGLLDRLAEQMRSYGTIEQSARMEGRTMTMYIAPLKQKQSLHEREGELRRGENQGKDPQGSEAPLRDDLDREAPADTRDEEPLSAPEGTTS
jgi:translation initiation factor IF-3